MSLPEIKSSENRKPRDHVSVLDRGLKILTTFGRDNPELVLSDVARRVKLSPATTRRLLLTFADLGYVSVNGRHFSLRPKVLELGFGFFSSMGVEQLIQPYLQEIVRETGDSSSLVVIDDDDTLVLANATAPQIVRLPSVVGARFPAYATSSGRAVLANCSTEYLKGYFQRVRLQRITEFTETNIATLKRILRNIRQSGYAVVRDELDIGLIGVSVPLRDATGKVIASINCSACGRHIDFDEFCHTRLKILQEYAAKMSAELASFPNFPRALAESRINRAPSLVKSSRPQARARKRRSSR